MTTGARSAPHLQGSAPRQLQRLVVRPLDSRGCHLGLLRRSLDGRLVPRCTTLIRAPTFSSLTLGGPCQPPSRTGYASSPGEGWRATEPQPRGSDPSARDVTRRGWQRRNRRAVLFDHPSRSTATQGAGRRQRCSSNSVPTNPLFRDSQADASRKAARHVPLPLSSKKPSHRASPDVAVRSPSRPFADSQQGPHNTADQLRSATQ